MWQISPTGHVVNLTRSSEPHIADLRTLSADGGILRGTVDGGQAIIRVVDETVSFAHVESPRAGGRLRAFSPLGDAFLSTGDFSNGTLLWIAGGGGRSLSDAAVAWHGNRWVEEVEVGKEEYFRYTAMDGQEYGGWLLTPADDTAARKLPLIVDVYPGLVQNEATSPFAILSPYFLNQQLFAARGYAVLLPSVPDVNGLRGAERLRSLTVGILPAVDTLIARGIVDPERLAIVGQSAGGYATLGLIGQTTRFKAAIASASYSNLISLYGTFYGQHRYGDGGDPQAGQVLRMLQLERGYASMGGPPWERLDDYVGASPLFHVSKVQTPVMLVHGDFDFIPIQQAEEYFTALYRLDKRVQFVRYHGEEHTPSTRGNVIDLWQRIDAWLTELLGKQDRRAPTRP
jgi:dipeptidyl aminopeptidase/acylaminoacyl peptidase